MCSEPINRQIILASRPKGMPKLSDFILLEASIPVPQEGELLIRTLYISVDPYLRGRMNEGPSYIPAFQLNKPPSSGVIGEVVESKCAGFKAGDLVQGLLEWADYCVTDGKNLEKIDPTFAPITTALGILGMPGLTAYFGLLDIGQPKQGETVVVSGAAGAVGITAGQIAKIKGCRVVGIVGNDTKADYIKQELGFDEAINYHHANYADELRKACPKGVDIYFDNVGGTITDNVLKLINKHARIVLCGQISMYNLEEADTGPRNYMLLLAKSALLKGFIVFDYSERYPEGIKQMAQWLKEGKIKYRENIVEGLENLPKALLGLFRGENIGKQLVKVSD
jgi:NADPH-dependent curcumin reductase CurA